MAAPTYSQVQEKPLYQPPQYAPPLPMEQGQKSYNELYNHQGPMQEQQKSIWTHEAVAAAAGLAAMNAWEAHAKAGGQEPTHEVMKETLAAMAAAEVDRLIETNGLTWIDKERAQHDAIVQAQHYAEEKYGTSSTGWEHAQTHPAPKEYVWPGNYGPAPYYPAYGMWRTGWARPGGFGAGYGPLMGYGPLTDRLGMAVESWRYGGPLGMRLLNSGVVGLIGGRRPGEPVPPLF
ncbi:hypothetical protein CALCODRAFT_503772 [Calocera cornea HHB12733]|uniref:Uncharacterized protein n=1 Tax=Calocera cornea HHB12733 TaxID=1353952 RepID=A0A165CRD3_9BASI|nr:hypothetical protein CALCODRAFT_503772 [Calocera cornea HHB12733]